MGTLLLQIILALATALLMINGVIAPAANVAKSAAKTASTANVHQLSVALELYYLDHHSYPSVKNGIQLINTLFAGGYIQSKPTDATAFQYQAKSEGNAYSLGMKANEPEKPPE